MNKSIILVIIIGIIAVIGISYNITNSNNSIDKDSTTDSFKIGIVQWVTNEQFENNIQLILKPSNTSKLMPDKQIPNNYRISSRI